MDLGAIREMEPGEIDVLVARKVLGWTWEWEQTPPVLVGNGQYITGRSYRWKQPDGTWVDSEGSWISQRKIDDMSAAELADFDADPDEDETPLFSTDIAAAWEVVEALSSRFHWRITSSFEPGALWFAGLTPLRTSGWNGRPDIEASAESAPMAICLAALEAVGNGQSVLQRPAHGLGQ